MSRQLSGQSSQLERGRAVRHGLIPSVPVHSWRKVGLSLLTALTLLLGSNGPLAAGLGITPPTAAAAALRGTQGKPNLTDPLKNAKSIIHFLPPKPAPVGPTTAPKPSGPRTAAMSMQPGTLALDPAHAAHFVGSDNRLQLDVPAGAITSADVAAAGGKLSLSVRQIAPASGSLAGGSGLISFGMYLIQVVDAQGHLASHGLRAPVTARLQYGTHDSALDLSHAFVVTNGALPNTVTTAIAATSTSAALTSANATRVTAKQIGLGSYSTQNVAQDGTHHMLVLSSSPGGSLLKTPSSSLSWNTNSPIALFGKPNPFSVDLSGGSLTAGYPIDVPAGPGGLTPPVTLSYSSAGVAEQHNPQGAAGWVGEGWNLSLGSISWTEKNYTSYCDVPANQNLQQCQPNNTWQSTWQLSDPFGTSAELIPPNAAVATWYDDTNNHYYNNGYLAVPEVWQTAPASHIKAVDYVGTVNLHKPQGEHPPCFRVWLQNGIMEEFGCTSNSLDTYVVSPGGIAQSYVSSWLLDMITDPVGNQIHVTYNPDTQTKSGTNIQYPRDTVLNTIEWDSPGCHDAQNMCTGSAWTPLMEVSFAASHQLDTDHTYGSTCGAASNNLRCDDPIDFSGSGGMANPDVQSTFILDDVDVQVRSSGSDSWHVLRDYRLSYEQTAQQTTQDPATGMNESVAGELDLTEIQELGTDQSRATGMPPHIFSYISQDEHYEDQVYQPNPSTNCGFHWNMGPPGATGCVLWSMSYPGNDRYMQTASNGMGLQQSFTWEEARNNSHGVIGELYNMVTTYCNGKEIQGYPCDEPDDENWSRIVLQDEKDSVVLAASNGNTTVTTETKYQYTLTAPLKGNWCGDCNAGMYWGDQNDGDYLDYYNGHFMGFAQAQVAHSDGSLDVHDFYGTEGYGYYDTGQFNSNFQCNRPTSSQCNNTPWWDLTNAAHGHEYEMDSYGTNGQTLLKQTKAQYALTCPPQGVSPTPPVSPYGNFDYKLVAELDPGNPVAACDVETAQVDEYTWDGASSSTAVPDKTTRYYYDNYGRLTTTVMSSNDGGVPGSPTQIAKGTTYEWNDAVNLQLSSATGTYLIDFPSAEVTQDSPTSPTTRSSCTGIAYDGVLQSGQTSALKWGLQSGTIHYTGCGSSPNFAASGPLNVTTFYDNVGGGTFNYSSGQTYGNAVATADPDANANNPLHVGCTVSGSSTPYTSCTAYDGTYFAEPVSTTNALNQTSTIGYNAATDASGGYGLWPTSTTDVNNQVTKYTYDTLGRMTGQILPAEASGFTTTRWSYYDWCAGTSAQAPCVEIDQTQLVDSGTNTTAITRAFYDGFGRLVETRSPGPNGQDVVRYREYNNVGEDVVDSISYFVTAYTGAGGAAAFSTPDASRARTVTAYDGLGRVTSVSDPLSNTTTTSYAIPVPCQVVSSDNACYEATTVVDPLSHKSATYHDALGREIYDQRFTGNGGSVPYAVYATTTYTYDLNGNLVRILQPDGASTTTFQYDAAGRKMGMTDPDRGTEVYCYDQNGNVIQSMDGRSASVTCGGAPSGGGTTYSGYDGLDRLVWRSTNSNGSNPYVTYTYGTSAVNNNVGRLVSEVFSNPLNTSLSGTYNYTYDARGRQLSQTTSVNYTVGGLGYGAGYPVTNYYDDANDVTSQTYPDGETVSSTYAAPGWLASLSSSQGSTILASNIGYAPANAQDPVGAGQITSMTVDNNVLTYGAAFDGDARLTNRSLVKSGTTLYQTSPSYDAASNVTSVATWLPEGVDSQGFCYDEQNRLVWAGTTGTPPSGCPGAPPPPPGTVMSGAQYTQTFAYDVLGRLTSGALGNYTYGPGQQAGTNPSPLHAALTISNGWSAAYDAAGNMTCLGPASSTQCAGGTSTGNQLSWDNEGRLAVWQNAPGSSPTSSASELYDGSGQRVLEETVRVQGSGSQAQIYTTTTAYLGNLEEVAITYCSGGSPGLGCAPPITNTTTYYYAGGLRLALTTNGTFYYLGTDVLGSTEVTLTASGAEQGSFLYAPYGASRYASGQLQTLRRFTGQVRDATLGLTYYGARYYDVGAGQFVSADTVLAGGLNRYAYVDGNPETATDPTGHDAWWSDNASSGPSGGDDWWQEGAWTSANGRVTATNWVNTTTYLRYDDATMQQRGFRTGQVYNANPAVSINDPEYQDARALSQYYGLSILMQPVGGTATSDYVMGVDYVGHTTDSTTYVDGTPYTTVNYNISYGTPVDLYTPQAGTARKSIIDEARRKGREQAPVVVIDVSQNNLYKNANNATLQKLANQITNSGAVKQVVFIQNGQVIPTDVPEGSQPWLPGPNPYNLDYY